MRTSGWSLPAVVDPKVAQARRPSSMLERERVSYLVDGRGQMSADLASSFFRPSKTSKTVSAPEFAVAVTAKSCGGSCCAALVGPVVTVCQAGLPWIPGGEKSAG